EPMAKWMTDRFLELEVAADVVLPVPLHPNRRKERGYNQSELLAEIVAESLSLPLDLTSVVREKDTLASSGLEGGRKAREENMKDAFRLVSKESIAGKTVLVVDDVITTGTTSSFLAEVLKKGGAKKVYVVTFASTREKPPIQEGY
ncbi:MAG: ComF family protein, partial [Clostridia bacterium]|nr:ComF family protein [Clostridia bacterium]